MGPGELSGLLQVGAVGVIAWIFIRQSIGEKERVTKKLDEVTDRLLVLGQDNGKLVAENTESNNRLASAIEYQSAVLNGRPCLLPKGSAA